MLRILIKETTSYGTRDKFKEMLNNELYGEEFNHAIVRYDKCYGINENDAPENWTLQLYSENYHISFFCLAAGFGGTGPHDLKSILDLCGFKDTERVFTEVSLDFYN